MKLYEAPTAYIIDELLAREDGPAAIRSAAGRLVPHDRGGRKPKRKKCVRCGRWHKSARAAWTCKCEPEEGL
jgi:hypothetical protein